MIFIYMSVLPMSVVCVFSLLYHRLVCRKWLWHFLVILNCSIHAQLHNLVLHESNWDKDVFR